MTKHLPILSTKKLKISVTRQALLAGFAIIDYDFIEISFTGRIGQLKKNLVFTSCHGVAAFAKHSEKINSSQKYRGYCLKGATYEAVKKISCIEIVATAVDASSLAREIIADKTVRELSFICGNVRRDELPDILRRYDVSVEEMIVYETRPAGYPVKNAYKAILFFSPSAVDSFFQSNILAPRIPSFCLGEMTAAAVRQHTGNPIIIAADTSQESMLDALKYFFKIGKTKPNATIKRRNGETSETNDIAK